MNGNQTLVQRETFGGLCIVFFYVMPLSGFRAQIIEASGENLWEPPVVHGHAILNQIHVLFGNSSCSTHRDMLHSG